MTVCDCFRLLHLKVVFLPARMCCHAAFNLLHTLSIFQSLCLMEGYVLCSDGQRSVLHPASASTSCSS